MKTILMALYDYHSMGVRGLHSLLRSQGYDVESLYFMSTAYLDRIYKDAEVDQIVEWLKAKDPAYLGVGIRSPMFPLFALIARKVRKEIPNCKIIAGGPHAIADPYGCSKFAEYVVTGEGENGLLDVLNGCSEGVVNSEPIEDLDSLPFPYYGENAHAHGNVYQVSKLSYNSSRGCFFKCSYCQESLSKTPRRRKSVDSVIDDIHRFKELFPKVNIFTFADSIFAHDEDWLKVFGDEFIGSGLTFWGNGFAPLMSKTILGLLRRAGFNSMRIGVQSGSPFIREEIFNRKDSLDDVMRVAWEAHDAGISVHYDFIMENPYETAKTLSETRSFIKKLPSSAQINKFELRFWPGTPLTEKALKDGVIQADDVEGNDFRVGSWSYVYQRAHVTV